MELPDPEDVTALEKRMAEVVIGGAEVLPDRIVVQDYDPAWPRRYEREAARIAGALGDRVVRLEHVGSTSVPGLPAKPIIDIVLEVPDSAAETSVRARSRGGRLRPARPRAGMVRAPHAQSPRP